MPAATPAIMRWWVQRRRVRGATAVGPAPGGGLPRGGGFSGEVVMDESLLASRAGRYRE